MIALLLACRPDAVPDSASPAAVVHPTLMVTADRRDALLERADREPYATILATIAEEADKEPREQEGDVWDHDVWNHNAEIAQHSAFLAWLHDDAEAAAVALAEFERLDTDFASSTTWDVNIRMPHTLMGFTNALDLLLGTDLITDAQAAAAQEKITTINRQFYERYVEDDIYRLIALYPAQNNHPIRTAAAIGYVAIAFPDDPDAAKWGDWAFSELDYLWSEHGQYVQEDGGVSEGPFYFGFAWGVSTALFIAADNALSPDHVFSRNCINRQTVDPWADHGCVDGEEFTFDNPLFSPLYQATVDWSLSLRLPAGHRPPLADAYFNPFNGAVLLSSYVEDAGRYRWDWERESTDPMHMTHGIDLIGHHFVYLDDTVAAEEPPWTTRFLPAAGNAVFRSDWSEDALWGLLVAESGSARKTLHDHVDGTSFSVAAYGDYLLIDPGYYKPSQLDNARTADADAHNVILIDGQGAPDKGLLTDFGDADASLESFRELAAVDYAEAWQTYEQTDIQRSFALVRDRYFVVADRLTTQADAARSHALRLHLGAGEDLGGTVSLRADGVDLAQSQGAMAVTVGATEGVLRIETPELVEGEAPHAHKFDRSRTEGHHAVVDATTEGLAPDFLAILAPHPADEPAPEVEPLDAGAGQVAFLIDGEDLAFLRTPEASGSLTLPDGRAVITDAEFLLLSLSDETLTLLVRGSQVSLDGQVRGGEVIE